MWHMVCFDNDQKIHAEQALINKNSKWKKNESKQSNGASEIKKS